MSLFGREQVQSLTQGISSFRVPFLGARKGPHGGAKVAKLFKFFSGRIPEQSSNASSRTFNASPERERESAEMEEGGNAVVGISALVEFLIGWERSGKLGLLDTFNLVWIIDQNRPKSPTV